MDFIIEAWHIKKNLTGFVIKKNSILSLMIALLLFYGDFCLQPEIPKDMECALPV